MVATMDDEQINIALLVVALAGVALALFSFYLCLLDIGEPPVMIHYKW
jgi:hypothetical protein